MFNNKIFEFAFTLVGILFISACSQINIAGFDAESWKNDPFACKNQRAEQAELLINNKEKLRGLGQKSLKKFLGSPDKHELYNRNQKYFYYFIEPAANCEAGKVRPKYLSIRFNALNQAGEILIMDEPI